MVPDGSIDIIFNCSPSRPEAIIAGTVEISRENVFQGGCTYFGVRFVPGAFDHFGDISSSELIEQIADFSEVTGDQDLPERICLSPSFDEQIRFFLNSFGEQLSAAPALPGSSLVPGILEEIFRTAGNVRIRDLESSLHYSRRHLLRVFSDFTGMNIKGFSNIIR